MAHLAGQAPDRANVHPARGIVDDELAETLVATGGGTGPGENEAVARVHAVNGECLLGGAETGVHWERASG